MPSFIDIVSFPTTDGALHQVYANVHDDTNSKLSLDFDRAHLRLLLVSLRNRNEEPRRRTGRLPHDVTLGIIGHPSLDGDSMALAFAITEHMASFFGTNQTQGDGSLVLDGIPQIIATGEIDRSGIVQTVGGLDGKLTGVLDAIESGSLIPGGVFIYPKAAMSSSVSRLICELEAKGWRSWAISHIDDVIPLWQPAPRRPKLEQSIWASWKRPVKWGAVAAISLTVIAIFAVDTWTKQSESQTQTQTPPKACDGLFEEEYRNCIVDGAVGSAQN